MPALNASVSSEAPRGAAEGEPVLVCGANWVGDTLMSMPAIQALRRRLAGARLILLVKPTMVPLWQMHEAPDDIVPLRSGWGGTLATAAAVRARKIRCAWILPRSIRAALIPFLAGVPERQGWPGHSRDNLLTHVHPPPSAQGRQHQALDYLDFLAPEARDTEPLLPRLHVPPEAAEAARRWLEPLSRPVIALLPGAARGSSKRWPAGHFAELGRRLIASSGGSIVVAGGPSESSLCEDIARAVGPRALNLGGRTRLPEWAAVLAAVDGVVSNDSGGAHLAAGLGARVVVLFGLTDPVQTRPLGPRVHIVQAGKARSRDIPRRSREARNVLEELAPELVYRVVQDAVRDGRPLSGEV